MNTHSNKASKKEVENVSTRVENTKREIEQLKNELEKLICTGAQAAIPKLPLDINVPEIHIEPKHVEVRFQPKKTSLAPPKKPEHVQTSPSKKNRNYNVEEARDYIKKQKEKRAEQLKAQLNKADNQLDLKKQKLKELHQKTIELVSKNVQLKRERSKSREKEPPVRIDKSNPQHKFTVSHKPVGKSQERVKQPQVSSTRIKSQDRLKEPPVSNTRVKSEERLKQPPASNTRVKSQERLKQPPSSITRVKSQERLKEHPVSSKRIKSQERLEEPPVPSVKVQEKFKPHTSERVSRSRAREKLTPSARSQKIDPNFLYVSSKSEGKIIDLEKTVCPPHEEAVDLNQRIMDGSGISFEDSSNVKANKSTKQKKEHHILTDACLKDTKETQTNRSNNLGEVAWMQPPPAMPFPYNFINTVKRKLQFAINSPSYVDVGIQNTWDHQTPEFSKPKSKEEIRELLMKSANSDLKSFASHKCQNLDLKTVENLELIPSNQREKVSKNLFHDYDSESDTSKNIPEISSESLSLEKLRDMKLQKVSKSLSHNSIMTDTNGYNEWENNSYSSDFQKESAPSAKAKTEKSESSTIRTITSEKKQSEFAVPSDISISSTLTNNSRSTKHPQVSNTSFINTQRRDVENSQKSFLSLLTDGQLSQTESEKMTSKIVSESFNLKEPTVSLNIKKNEHSPDLTRSLMKTVTIRPSSSSVTNGSADFKHSQSVEDAQGSFKSSMTEDKVSNSNMEPVSENLETGFKSSSIGTVNQSLNLKEPTISLSVGSNQKRGDLVKSPMKNITIRQASGNNVNEIHLKFEAEVRLLNDFNESFKQFVAVEKAFENIKSKNDNSFAMNKILQNVDTQTSFLAKTSTNISSEKSSQNNRTSSINYSRGSDIIEEIDDLALNDIKNVSKSQLNTSFSTDWNLSNFNESTSTHISIEEDEKSRYSLSNMENYSAKNCAGLLSLNIFDQLIKDEDTRIQQLKAIIKIREQALLDRTRSELVWLEFQKKQLIETGKIEEASLLKKKQRGIILKHEQERNEIKKLKQMQKEASEHRKNTLKQQRNLIKTQLSTDNMLSKITVKKRKERRSMGPLRVVQSCSESIQSETSISLRSSGMDDVLSITSKSLKVSEESEVDFSRNLKEEDVPVANAKRTLLMREAALQKRRKAAEELLRWHRKLLEEERKIGELEAAATSVVGKKTQEVFHKDKYKFNGKQLNQLWKNMTGSEEKKFVDDKLYVMSQITLERLCKSARQYANKTRKVRSSEQSSVVSEEVRKSSDDANYSSVFEPDSVQEINNSQEEKTKISSISELIDNFSKIEDEISTLSKKSEEIVSLKEEPKKVSDVKEDQKEEIESESVTSSVKEVETVEESPKKSEETILEENISDVKEDTEEQKSPDEDISIEIVDQEGPKPDQEVSTAVEDQEQILTKNEDLETQVSTKIEEETKTISEIPTETEESYKDKGKELLSLEEAIESASKIEESLSKLNKKFSSEKTDEETEDVPIAEAIEVKTSTTIETADEETSQKTSQTEDISSKTRSLEIENKKSEISSISTEASDDKLSPSVTVQAEESEASPQIKSETPSGEEKTPEKKSELSSLSTEADEKTPQKKSPPNQIDVKKRVSEILADATLSRGDRSPRLQDLYVTTYDVMPPNALELNEPSEEGPQPPSDILGTEAEELWRKQLAIEQEIKQIQLQQKEQLPYMYVREIPNKPPPPYTPPSSLSSLSLSILPPDVKEISEVACYSSKVLYKAYQNNNLDKVKFSENGFKLFSKVEVPKVCAEFIFNICRDLAKSYCKQFEIVEEPSWLVLAKKPQMAKTKPPDAAGLERIFNNKLKELFGFKKVQVVESAIIKWGRKKRDHVDEVLVIESQEEESQWTNFDKDELIVKNQVTADIMKMLIEETASVFAKILTKKKSVLG